MRTFLLGIGLTCLTAFAACSDEEATITNTPPPTTTSTSSAGGSDTGGSDAGGSSAGGSTADGGSSQGGTGGTGGAAAGGNGGSGGSLVDCTPDPNGEACPECIKANCCMQAEACEADTECADCATCLAMGGGIQDCPDCSFTNSAAVALGACIAGSCQAPCGQGN